MNAYESKERNNYLEFLDKEDKYSEEEIKEFYQEIICEEPLIENVEVIQ